MKIVMIYNKIFYMQLEPNCSKIRLITKYSMSPTLCTHAGGH